MSEEIKRFGVAIGGPAGAALVATADLNDQIKRLRALLREARPFVVEVLTFEGDTADTHDGVLKRIDAELGKEES